MKLTKTDKNFLELYSDSKYDKPSVTIDAVILRLKNEENDNYRKLPEKKLQVYLIKRNYPPFKDCYSIPGTFIDLNFELNETMKLCVKNKVNLDEYYYEQLFTFGGKTRDPRTRVLSVSYMLLTNELSTIENGKWFSISTKILEEKNTPTNNGYLKTKTIQFDLESDNYTSKNVIKIEIKKENLLETKNVEILKTDLSFDHIKIIFYALERLKNKLEYTDIIFNLLPELFTLTELKMSYETILGEKLFDANFRRKTSKMVAPTTEYITGKGFRNSQLFKHNSTWNFNDLD